MLKKLTDCFQGARQFIAAVPSVSHSSAVSLVSVLVVQGAEETLMPMVHTEEFRRQKTRPGPTFFNVYFHNQYSAIRSMYLKRPWEIHYCAASVFSEEISLNSSKCFQSLSQTA